MILRAALDGFGIAYMPESLVEEHLAARDLVWELRTTWSPPFPVYHLYDPSRRHRAPAFVVVVEALRYRPGSKRLQGS